MINQPIKNPSEKSLIAANSLIKLKIPKKKAQAAYQQTLKKMSRQVKMAGFRKGKVPQKLAEKQLDVNKIIYQVLHQVLPKIYADEIKKQNKKPLTQPKFDLKKVDLDQDWEVEAYFAEEPKIELKNYQQVVKKAKKMALEEIKKIEAQLKKSQSTTDNNQNNKKNKSSPALQQKLSANQKKDITLQLIFRELINDFQPAIPQLLVEEESQKSLYRLLENLKKMNLNLNSYLTKQQLSFEQLSQSLAAEALGKLQVDFILKKITNQEKLILSDQELATKIKKITDQQLQTKIKKDSEYQLYLKSLYSRQKTLDFLMEIE